MILFCAAELQEAFENLQIYDLIDKSDSHRKLICQWKCSFDDKIATNEKFNILSFNKGSVKCVKPNRVGFCILEISKYLMYECYCDKKQPNVGEETLELHCMDTDSFIFSFKLSNQIKDLSEKWTFEIRTFADKVHLKSFNQKILKKY